MVRNSSVEFTEVVLMEGPFVDGIECEGLEEDGAGLAFAWAAVEEVVMVEAVNGDELWAC